MTRWIMWVAATAGVLALAPAVGAGGGDASKGQTFFAMYCSACHGSTGKGDGPGAGALNPRPRDLTDGAYMVKLNDQYLIQVIGKGGASVGKSVVMPPWTPPLTDQDILNIVAYIRSLSKR